MSSELETALLFFLEMNDALDDYLTNTLGSRTLDCAFIWDASKQGRKYWCNLDLEFREFTNEKYK